MTIEIRELVIRVEVTDPPQQLLPGSPKYSEWDEQHLLEKLKREVLDYLLERGHL